MPACGYEYYLRVFNSISHSFATLDDKIHIHKLACNILYSSLYISLLPTLHLTVPKFEISQILLVFSVPSFKIDQIKIRIVQYIKSRIWGKQDG